MKTSVSKPPLLSCDSKTRGLTKVFSLIGWLYKLLVGRFYSATIFFALICTIAVKLLQSWRINQLSQFPGWILADIAVLLGIEILLSVMCFFWPGKRSFRTATGIAAVICTWSVINAAWLLRTGKQILPLQLFPLIRDPWTTLAIVVENMIKMPTAALILAIPCVVAIVFLTIVIVKPKLAVYNIKVFIGKTIITAVIIFVATAAYNAAAGEQSAKSKNIDLGYNCQLKAVTSQLLKDTGWLAGDFKPKRTLPHCDDIEVTGAAGGPKEKYNVVIIVLEGIQYRHTSLYNPNANLTPHMAKIAQEGVDFSDCRSSYTHTSKAIFALLSGQHPSPSQDIVETIPVEKPYASLASILKEKFSYRTAFFQSAKGEFESCPALAYNLGFDKFWARENSGQPERFLGYQSCDEFVMLKPITEWINQKSDPLRQRSEASPFLLVVGCSVSHDPYVVPKWYANAADDHLKRYLQTVSYTDTFIKSLDSELTKLNLKNNTIFCIVGDHGEAFGEHGQFAHEGVPYEESMRIPWVIRAPKLIEGNLKITEPVSSVDLTPTFLSLLGLQGKQDTFNGINVLGKIPQDRKNFFVGGMYYGPIGYVRGPQKFVYDCITKQVFSYNLASDPFERRQINLSELTCRQIADEIKNWQRDNILKIEQKHVGKKILYDDWHITWGNAICRTKFRPFQFFAKQ